MVCKLPEHRPRIRVRMRRQQPAEQKEPLRRSQHLQVSKRTDAPGRHLCAAKCFRTGQAAIQVAKWDGVCLWFAAAFLTFRAALRQSYAIGEAIWDPTLLSIHPAHQLIRSLPYTPHPAGHLQYICPALRSLVLVNPMSYLLLVERRPAVIVRTHYTTNIKALWFC